MEFTTRCNNDTDFSILVKIIISLVFVRLEDLDIIVDLLDENLNKELHITYWNSSKTI